ncbi:unnamed protein product [Calypogeia fissa]
MKPSMEAAFGKALENSPQEFISLVAQHQSRADKFIVKSLLSKCSLQSARQICDALASTTSLALDSYKKLLEQQQEEQDTNVEEQQEQAENVEQQQVENIEHQVENVSPQCSPSPPRQGTRSRRAQGKNGAPHTSGVETSQISLSEETGNTELGKILKTLHCCVFLAHVSVTEGLAVMQTSGLFPTVLSLHDSLILLEGDTNLQESIAGLCELWWRENLEQKESLTVQCLPFLSSKALAWGKKKDVQRLYGMRNALVLFDFYDDSIKDMKHLLIRTVVTPAFLRTQNGRKFISFLFVLDPQLVKELIVIIRSQIPYGRKSILEAYGEILYQAWKAAEGPCLHEIEFTCIQGLFETALYASSKALGAAVRTVLEGFAAQKAQDGVESMLFWLLEPLLFRALQAANSNVRQNALLVLVDVFPLEDPAASKEEKEVVLEKQFGLLEKLLMDPCPDVRSVAVKVVCRILRLFWEIVPSAVTVRLLTKVVDDMAKDSTSNSVRLAVLQGVIYLLENAQSHALLKAILPKLGPMLNDTSLAVRVAAADLLLVIKGIPIIQFYKVAPLETLLSSLGNDNSLVAQRLTRLLLHSYFPPQVPVKEACKRCLVLLKRAPEAGAKFCKWLLVEGASPKSLLQLVESLIRTVKDDALTQEVRTGILLALSEVSESLLAGRDYKTVIEEMLNGDVLAALMGYAPDSLARSYVLQIASTLPPKDISKLVNYCCELSMRCPVTPADIEEVSAVHTLVLAWGGLDELLAALTNLLSDSINVPHSTYKAGRDRVPPTQVRGSKDVESAWSSLLTSNSSKPSEAGKGNARYNFIAASGAAWQVEMLLNGEETRLAVLRYGQLKELLQALRTMAQVAITRAADGSTDLASTCHPASSVLAYIKLYFHIVMEGSDAVEQENKSTNARRGQQKRSDFSPVGLGQISDGFEKAWEELVGWLRDMLAKQSGSRSPSAVTSPSQRKSKHARRKLRSREPLSPLSQNAEPGSHKKAKNNEEIAADLEERNKEAISALVSKTAQIISDSFTLGLVNSAALRQVSADLVTDSIQWLSERFSTEEGSESCLPHGFNEHWAKYVQAIS